MSNFNRLMTDLVGAEGLQKLSAALGSNVEGTALGAYTAARASLAWFNQNVQSVRPGTGRYVQMPGSDHCQIYLEKSEDGKIGAELVRDGSAYYVFENLNKSEGSGNWSEKVTAVPHTILTESKISFPAPKDHGLDKLSPKVGQAIDALVARELSKADTSKKVEGDKQEVKDDVTPKEKGEDDADRYDNDDRVTDRGENIDTLDHRAEFSHDKGKSLKQKVAKEEPKASECEKPVKELVAGEALTRCGSKSCKCGKKKSLGKSEPLEKPYASDAQRRKFHAMENRGEISHATVKEFDQASKGKKLPERVEKGVREEMVQGLGTPDVQSAVDKLKAMRPGAPKGVDGTQGGHLKSAREKLRRMAAARNVREITGSPVPQAPVHSGPKREIIGVGLGVKGVPNMGTRKSEIAKSGENPPQAGATKIPHKPLTNRMASVRHPHSGTKLPTPSKIKEPSVDSRFSIVTPDTTKSEKAFVVTEQELYKPCWHCGIPEFVKSEDGSHKFKPCACFVSETRSMSGEPKKFVELVKSEDGTMKLKFSKNADPEAQKLFLLLLKTTVLAQKNFRQ